MLADRSTLLVEYRDLKSDCIECKKCVRVCHMGIDIRHSPHQIECVHCGECIDACVDVLGRLGKDGLIHYAWGSQGRTTGEGRVIEPWYMRLGFRDARRVVILLIVLVYASGLGVALAMRHTVLVKIAPDRASQAVMFTTDAEGRIVNRYRMILANRGTEEARVVLEIQGLPGATLENVRTTVVLAPGQELSQGFEIAAPARGLQPLVNHFRVVARAEPGSTVDQFDMTFIAPGDVRPPAE
jgi:polyferredoxin